MTRTYENVGRAARSRRTVRRRRRRSALTAAIVSAAIYAAGVFAIVMYARAVWFDTVGTELPPEPPPVSTHQPVQTPPPTGPASEEPVVESRYVLYDIQLSEELQHYTQDVCEEYGVSYPLVIAIMKKESEFRSDAVSATNDYGIMQINGWNHEWLEGALGITDWLDPQQNILAGVYMLAQFNGYEDVHQILMSYNCGPSGAKKLLAEGVYSTAYSRSVVEILEGLEVMNDG